MKKTFILSDESLNSYGFWVKTDGIDLSGFLKNPVMLWNHARNYGYSKEEILPIGSWEDVKIEDGKLVATAVFDEKDEFAKKIASKVEQGVLSAVSIGFRKEEVSSDIRYLKMGQTRETVIKCSLKECSICDIPSNSNAVALYDEDDNLINLSQGGDTALPKKINFNNKNSMNKEINLALGLASEATEQDALTAALALKKQNEDLHKQLSESEAAQLNDLVTAAITERRCTEDKRQVLLAVGKTSGFAALKGVISAMNPAVKPMDILFGRDKRGTAATNRTFAELTDVERQELRSNDKENYSSLFEKEYGYKPELD